MNLEQKLFSQETIQELEKKAQIARGAIVKMTSLASSGHPGGSMSTIDILLSLYEMINHDSKNAQKVDRDRIIVSNGHISPAVYTTLALNGYFNLEDAVSQFRKLGSIYEGHIEPDVAGVEWGTGNLGQGLSAACGKALACKMKEIDNQFFVIMGDGEQQKGQISEARRFAVKYKLSNITTIVDYNKLQICGNINDVMPQDIKANFESDGWDVIEVNGHDFKDLNKAILDAVKSEKPVMILAKTIMGKGVSFMENKEKYHGSPLTEEQLEAALKELKIENNMDEMKKLRSEFSNIKENHVKEYDIKINPGLPNLYKKKTDNRSAWGNAIANIATVNNHENTPIAVFDCDLKGSVKTGDFARVSPNNFFESGIMEHHTATMAGAMSHEGIQVFFADFGVFGIDEVFNQLRLNDINHTNLKVITTHVGLDVGEDGKTHQCINYLGVMKNLYHFKTIIPGGPNQTDRIIRHIASEQGNFLVPMGRSKLDPITTTGDKLFYDDLYNFEYGKADKLRDGNKAALLVMGTLTVNAVAVADKLKEEGIDIQVWNVSCPMDIDVEMLKEAVKTGYIFTYEDHNTNTGLGCCVANAMIDNEIPCKLKRFGVKEYAMSGNANDLFKHLELDVDGMVKNIKKVLG